MSQRISSGWTLYLFVILLAVVATIHAWMAGAPYFGKEFRAVELLKVWSVTDDEKTTWRGEYLDQLTQTKFEHDIAPKAAVEFQQQGNAPKATSIVLEIGVVDPIAKEQRDHFYRYRWIATGTLVFLLFWWVIFQSPEVLLIFAIFSD